MQEGCFALLSMTAQNNNERKRALVSFRKEKAYKSAAPVLIGESSAVRGLKQNANDTTIKNALETASYTAICAALYTAIDIARTHKAPTGCLVGAGSCTLLRRPNC